MGERTPQRKQEAFDRAAAARAYFKDTGLITTMSPMYDEKWLGFIQTLIKNLPPVPEARLDKELQGANEKKMLAELFAADTVPAQLEALTWLPAEWKFRIDPQRRGENRALDERSNRQFKVVDDYVRLLRRPGVPAL